MKIQEKTFGIAGEKIETYQEKYRKKYNKKNATVSFTKVFPVGSKVQYRKHKSKNQRGRKSDLVWLPRDGYCKIIKINALFKKVTLKYKEEEIEVSFTRIRHFNNVTLKK